ncbi:MAG TPA: dethiobiotin synthetase, partial [Thermoanaerobaculia bacterium]|nr:dethiobiotin synthetase [Thermoanaerobaculia bacterium]
MLARLQIAVVGAGTCDAATAERAAAVGRGLALAGAVLVTGGRTGVMAAASAGARAAGGPSEGEFADLLRRAASGELVSGVPVSVDRDAGVALSEDQLARLSLAADRAEAEG